MFLSFMNTDTIFRITSKINIQKECTLVNKEDNYIIYAICKKKNLHLLS